MSFYLSSIGGNRKELLHHFLQTLLLHHCFNGTAAFLSVWGNNICVKLPVNKELRTPGGLTDGCQYALQGGGVVRREIASENVPAAPSYLQTEVDNIRDVQLKCHH